MIHDIKAVKVTCNGQKVGMLSMDSDSLCCFEYDKEWLADGYSISPLQLPLKAGLFTAGYQPFNGCFGIFEDSLPEGYGDYLLQKSLRKLGISYRTLSPLQRLSLVGSSGMGALCYEPQTNFPHDEFLGTFDELQQMALDVLSEKTDTYAGLLYSRSGNSGGVRPKCVFADKDGHWIVKFRHTFDPKNMGEIEYSYNMAARKCGIEVPEFKLIDGKYFAERRFDIDKENGTRLHVATASALLNEPISPPKMDYHSLLQLTGYLTQSPLQVEQQFRRMAFNVYARIYDDHARNFSFIYKDTKWQLAPAYDLTNDHTLGEHATTVNFKGLPTDEDMVTVGENIRITRQRCMQIIDEVREGTKDLQVFF